MPPKKKKIAPEDKPPAIPQEVVPQYRDEAGRACLPPVRVWQFRALSAELEKNTVLYAKARADLEAGIQANPVLMEYRRLVSIYKNAIVSGTEKVNQFKTEVEAESGIDLSRCAIEDETGVIEVVIDKEAEKNEG